MKLSQKLVSGLLLCTTIAYTMPILAYTKDETIFSKTTSSGEAYETVVSARLKNDDEKKLLNDLSNLMDIENVNGDETFEKNGESIVWNADGKNIYYQGNSEEALPIDLNVTFKLDGETISKDEIIGKSGKVEIVLSYTNNAKQVVNINGKPTTLYTPFVVVAGTVINNEKNTNITVSSGKVLDQDKKTVVTGVCLPGMQESLNISKDKIDIPDSITITMDATDFEIGSIMSFMTPKAFVDTDSKLWDDLDEVYSKVNELQNASNQLVNGTGALKDGASQLNTGAHQLSKELNSKIDTYYNMKSQLSNKKQVEQKIADIINQELQKMMPSIQAQAEKEAADAIKNHKSELEQSTVDTAKNYTKKAVQNKLNDLAQQGDFLTDAQRKQLEDAITKDIQKVLTDIESNEDMQKFEKAVEDAVVQDVKSSVSAGTSKAVSDMVDKNKQAIDVASPASLTADASDMVALVAAGLQAKGLDEATAKAQAQAYVATLIKQTSKNTLDQVKDQSSSISDAVVDQSVTNIKKAMTTDGAVEQAIQKLEKAIAQNLAKELNTNNPEVVQATEDAIAQYIINDLLETLSNDKVFQTYLNQAETQVKNEISTTIEQVANATAKDLASQYTETLANEIAQNLIKKQLSGKITDSDIDKVFSKYEDLFNTKIKEADQGMKELKTALKQLTNGTEQLSEGSKQLADGMKTFHETGINKICNYINSDVRDVATRAEKLQELSKEYQNFSKTADNNDVTVGDINFIYVTDGVKKHDDDDNNA